MTGSARTPTARRRRRWNPPPRSPTRSSLPGDLFDIRAPKPEVLAEAINLFRSVSKRKWGARVTSFEAEGKAYTDVPVIAIPGTHERRAQRMENPVNLLALAGMLIDVSDGFAVIEKGGEKVAVYGIGGVSRSTSPRR